jgi:O-antigen/teichoic acid export membrane protein
MEKRNKDSLGFRELGTFFRKREGILSHFMGTLFANLTALFSITLYNILVSRLLGPPGRGELAAITNWAIVGSVVASFGIPDAITYLGKKKVHDLNSLVISSITITQICSLLIIGVLYPTIPWLLHAQSEDTIKFTRLYLLVYLPVQCINAIITKIPLILDRWDEWNCLRVMALPAFFLGIGTSYICREVTAAGIAFSVLAWYLIINALICVIEARYLKPWPTLAASRDLLKFGVPRVFGQFVSTLNLRVDQLVMASFMPANLLGLYAVAVVWSNILTPLVETSSQIVFPYIASNGGANADRSHIAAMMRINITAVLLLTAFLFFLTPVAFPFVFGHDFKPAILPALILVAAAGSSASKGVAGAVLNGLGQPKYAATAEMVSFIATGVGLAIFLPLWQITGAAIASFLSYTIAAFYLIAVVRKQVRAPNILQLVIFRLEDVALLGRAIRER